MRPDQQRVQTLLTDTVTLLCKNGLQYNKALKVQGLLGITLDDDDVFIVHINKMFDGVNTKVTGIGSGDDPGFVMNNISGLAGLNNFNQFENVDGLSFEDEDQAETASNNGMQLPVIHAQQPSILNQRNTNSSTKKPVPRGVKRPIGAAKRKESRSVKQRVSASFSQEIHHVQMNKDSGFTPEYQEIHIKDEPPDQLIITDNNEIRENSTAPTLETASQASNYNSNSHDSFPPAQNSMLTYESLEDCDDSPASPATRKNNNQMDMIECLLYKEGIDQSQRSKVHISGAEDADGDSVSDEMGRNMAGWEEMEFSSSDDFEDYSSQMPKGTCAESIERRFSSVNNNSASVKSQQLSEEYILRHGMFKRRKQRTRHPVNASEKPFVCPDETCGLRYYRKDNMIRHHLMKHGVKLAM